jgi:PhzF family phenazine biosynthesis protein
MIMKTLSIFQVDAFTTQLFGGNPAAVVPLETWLPDETMQRIAMENNLAETAFIVREAEGYHIRWFTPAVEVDLCGHATLASAYVYFSEIGHSAPSISFRSRSGVLTVQRNGNELTLDFPVDELREVPLTAELTAPFSETPLAAFKGKTDYMLVFASESEIAAMVPDLSRIHVLDARGVIVTAKGNDADFVSRFFAPQAGINEDPATGSAHTSLTPYWARQLGKKTMKALQLSARGGSLTCTDEGSRILIAGECRFYLRGQIFIP